jgi:hypothetical protein
LLQNVSMVARYGSNAEFFARYQPDDIRRRLLDQCLAPIRRYAEGRSGLTID